MVEESNTGGRLMRELWPLRLRENLGRNNVFSQRLHDDLEVS